MDWQLLAYTAPDITKEFGFTSSQMGILLGAPLIGVGIGGIVSGWLADKMGRVKAMGLCLIWFSFSWLWVSTKATLTIAIGGTAALYLLAIVPLLFLPETKQKSSI
jgi:MFS family permease